MDYFSSQCDQTMHCFAKDSEGAIQAYHTVGDGSYILCETAEFRFFGFINGEMDRLVNCPWCDKTVEEKHIRKCSGYQKPYSREEIMDAYSDPTERAKRDILLSRLEG